MSLKGRLLSLSLLLSIIWLFLLFSLAPCLSCSHLLSQIKLASSGIQTVQGQNRDMLGAMDCPSVCACVCVCVCGGGGCYVETLKLFSPCPNRLEARPSPFNPLMLHHTLTHKQSPLNRQLWTHLTTHSKI
ncbi:hypothetical protein ATANTOWER_032771 [Ataeniobius toweri]|uniref:Secreted protein n=1 Tax=Ataeniobius toweri TaxID=208326 RepID=A0ABU7A0M5_9TELE|nr:hypothetical protein [Ataeniobius toweri]